MSYGLTTCRLPPCSLLLMTFVLRRSLQYQTSVDSQSHNDPTTRDMGYTTRSIGDENWQSDDSNVKSARQLEDKDLYVKCRLAIDRSYAGISRIPSPVKASVFGLGLFRHNEWSVLPAAAEICAWRDDSAKEDVSATGSIPLSPQGASSTSGLGKGRLRRTLART